MTRSLRFRLLLLTAVVVGVALAAAALVSRVAVRREFQRLETSDRDRSLERAAELLSERVQRLGESAATDSELARLASSIDEELILARPDGRVIAASKPELRAAKFQSVEAGRIVIESVARRGRALVVRRAEIAGRAGVELKARDGSLLGRLYPLPRELGSGTGREPTFLLAVNRWLLLAVFASGALALLLTLALSRRILGPVETLTRAARRMEAGDLSQRVAVESGDEIGALARAFNAMADSLERNEALRSGLVTDVAHELRTPLTNLRCQIEAIQDGLIPASEATVRSLHDEALLLGRLVDDLQELALAEAGQLPLQREPVAIRPALEAALAAVSARAAESGVTTSAEVARDVQEIDADPQRLAQILRSLLANALAQMPQGGSIAITAAAAGDNVEIAVEDTGPGIPPEHLPHVFDRFYRVDPSRARASGGAGLGLAIVRQLVEAHGGRVRVESQPDRGARFAFTLPARRPS